MDMQKFFKGNERVNVFNKNNKTYYKAVVWDVSSSGLIINQPTSKHGQLNLTEGSTWEFNIESEDALYYFTAKVSKRKKGTTPLYLIEYPKTMRRQQRRQFFRLTCNLEVEYKILNEGEEETKDEEVDKKHDDKLIEITEENEMFNDIKAFDERTAGKEDEEGVYPAFTVDISGGGMQIVSAKYLNAETDLLLKINLPTIKEEVKLKAKVIRSFSLQAGTSKKFRSAIAFKDIDEKTRDIIIQFIFDQSRKRTRDCDM